LDAVDLGRLLLIRHFELRLLELFADGQLNGTTHTCLGQEYVPVALTPLLNPHDFIFSNHRGHGHYLARFDDPEGLLAEIMGRAGAICAGVGGSQHIYRDRYLSTGVQGQSLAVAVGVALRARAQASQALSVAYIGDGTFGEGGVYEALNMASLWQLPLLVVVEHNKIAQSTPTGQQMAGTVAARARAFDIAHHRVSGHDVGRIREELAPLLRRARGERRPLMVEFDTYRLGPHSKGDDARDPALIDEARRHDWYRGYARQYPEQFEPADRRAAQRVADVVREVSNRPFSTWESPCA
jgi:pyruvate dehydrogenase E1 component alpha subunit